MTKKTDLAQKWSSLVRWALGIGFLWIAYTHEDAAALYFFGTAFFISGFFKPRRCSQANCS